jgi:hypothetical protein
VPRRISAQPNPQESFPMPEPVKTDAATPATPAIEATGPAEFSVPSDLTTLDEATFTSLQSQVNARGAELASKTDLSDDELDEAEGLGAVADEFETEGQRRASELAARGERASAALDKFKLFEKKGDANDDAEDDDDGDDKKKKGRPFAAETTELAEQAPTTELAEGEKEPAVSRPTSFKGASPAFIKSKANVAEMSSRRESDEFMVATGFSKDPEGTSYDTPADVAKALWKKRMAFGNIPHGTNEMLSIATGTKTFKDDVPMLGLDPQENLVTLREIQHALVASGEFCTPQTQLYDFFRLAQPIRDVEDAIPTVQAPRGGIRFITANCTLGGADCIGSYTYDPATAGGPDSENPDFEKPCCRVSCPDIEESFVEAITQCTIFDNLQYRTFPELIENFMEDIAVQFTLRKQRYYLDKIDAASTATTGIGSYGASRSLFYDWMVAAIAYRKRHHMPRGANLQLMAPDWAVDLIKADLFNDGDQGGLAALNIPDSAVTAGLATRDLSVTWYYDDPTSFVGQNPLFDAQAGSKADLNDFAAEVVSFMYAPGTFVKLDGGSLDLGLVRDHSLNKTNDFAMFMEEWIGFAQPGCESVRIDSLVCPSGSRAPYAGALRTCAAAVS